MIEATDQAFYNTISLNTQIADLLNWTKISDMH